MRADAGYLILDTGWSSIDKRFFKIIFLSVSDYKRIPRNKKAPDTSGAF